ncbi:hypothetical protein LX12_002018 [Williamsia serinedens]|uniref:Uncharacterized protein n=2 Tax=Williamsia serinedens TaxID=391736 RepID=A0ABT1H116_9NOCA|nr:hypothetical protein [Williamsia serinedens]
MESTGDNWMPRTHILVREPDDDGYDLPGWVEVGERVVGLVATGLWAVDGVYDVVDGDRRRDGPNLSPTDPFVDHCGVSLFAVEARVRRALPRTITTLEVGLADLTIAAIRAETISPTRWYRVDHSCASEGVTAYDAAIARTWGCNTCGRDPRTEFTPRFEAHRIGLRIDARIDLDISIAVCPSCHEILHQPLAPTAAELMYGLRPSCPGCGARHADIVTVNHSDAPLPIGVTTSSAPPGEMPDFVCGSCGHEW